MDTISTELILIFLVITVIISIIAFLSGKKMGSSIENIQNINEGKKLRREYSLLESQKNELQRSMETINQKNEKYLYFLIRLPEAVKRLNSNLTSDEVIASIIRLTKDLIDTDIIELYMFNKTKTCLDLVAAFGSNREKSIEVKLGEGIIGEAASNKTVISKEYMSPPIRDERIEFGVPILFRNNLMGVIGVGKIKTQTGNEKQFLAMVADLAAVSLQNCEYLTAAKEEAITDPLTGLYNKRYFLERAIEDAQKAKNYNYPLSIFIFDVDNFKNFNDRNGHVQGDVLLKELSRLVKDNSRATDTIARYGGEEFICLLPNTKKEYAMIYAEKIRKLIESYHFRYMENQPLGCVSISGGVATFPSDGSAIEEVIRNADKALYEAKTAGRNKVIKYEPFQFSSTN